jgi:hypothetical protein
VALVKQHALAVDVFLECVQQELLVAVLEVTCRGEGTTEGQDIPVDGDQWDGSLVPHRVAVAVGLGVRGRLGGVHRHQGVVGQLRAVRGEQTPRGVKHQRLDTIVPCRRAAGQCGQQATRPDPDRREEVPSTHYRSPWGRPT